MTWAFHCKRVVPCIACDEMVAEAWERMTYGGLGFHPKRALVTYVGEFTHRPSQTKYVREGSIAAR